MAGLGEAFVGAVIQTVVEMLASGAIAQILTYVKGKKVDPNTIKNFEKSLRKIAAVLNDAQERRIEIQSFKSWVEELQDLAYDLDDVLDELATDAQLQLQQQGEDDEDYGSVARNITCLHSAKTKVKSILACGSRVVQRSHYSGGDLPSKIEGINSRLQQIHMQGQELGLVDRIIKPDEMQYLIEATNPISSGRQTTFVNEPIVFGREKKKREVICELLKDESGNANFAVIPIVGNGGIGKTTLAQYVYNDQQLEDHFDIKAWVCVSDVFDDTRVTTDIINSSMKKRRKFSNLNEAQSELMRVISDQRFLIVLDDIWIKKYRVWMQFQKPFQCGATGSKVIVTTRDEVIARMVQENNPTHPIIDLELLSNEHCWRLFQRHANEDSNDLLEMKDDIINKINGLPLAATALGGLFRQTMDKSQRRMILNNNVWTEESEVLPVLRLSYYHLPPHLKHIFAFCCIIPKDYEFGEMEMILFWMAQGFLIGKKEERIEDVGHSYFLDLVSRSLFERHPSKKKCYKMHDLVHHLAQWAASDFCCCIMDMKDVQRELERTRHLCMTSSVTDHTLRILQPVADKLRTLICLGQKHIDGLNVGFLDFIIRFRCIRTLILASETVEELPDCVGDFKHMRFLDLRFSKIEALPTSIKKLCNLQVLFVDGCYNLRKVTNIRFLVKLRHLRFHQSLWEAMPWGIGKLTNLQSLGRNIYLGVDQRSGSMIRELGSLNHLRGKLSIKGLENVRKVDDARKALLHEKKGLTRMHLEWSKFDDKNEIDISEQLKPHTSIEECKLKGYMGLTFPAWLGDASFERMAAIKLIGCEKCVCLPPLGQLPLLKKLVIMSMHGIKEVGLSALGGSGCLEELYIEYCDSLISINEIPSSIQELRISGCQKLEEVKFTSLATSSAPNRVCIKIVGNQSLVTLGPIPLMIEKLYIESCKELKSLYFSKKALLIEEEKDVLGGGWSLEVSEKQIQDDAPIELAHLSHLHISGCNNFISLPADLLLPSVQSISFSDNRRQEVFPEQLHTFNSLESLRISECPKIRCFPKGGLPKTETLKSVVVDGVNIEQPPIGEWGLDLLIHLEILTIGVKGCSTDSVECIPGPHLHLPSSSLSELKICGFKNLTSLNSSSFPNLTRLLIYKCPKLENLGDYNCLPPILTQLLVQECPMIEQQCKPDPNGLIALHDSDNRYSLIA